MCVAGPGVLPFCTGITSATPRTACACHHKLCHVPTICARGLAMTQQTIIFPPVKLFPMAVYVWEASDAPLWCSPAMHGAADPAACACFTMPVIFALLGISMPLLSAPGCVAPKAHQCRCSFAQSAHALSTPPMVGAAELVKCWVCAYDIYQMHAACLHAQAASTQHHAGMGPGVKQSGSSVVWRDINVVVPRCWSAQPVWLAGLRGMALHNIAGELLGCGVAWPIPY